MPNHAPWSTVFKLKTCLYCRGDRAQCPEYLDIEILQIKIRYYKLKFTTKGCWRNIRVFHAALIDERLLTILFEWSNPCTKYCVKFVKLTSEINQQFRSPPLLDRFCSCEFDCYSPGVDQRRENYLPQLVGANGRQNPSAQLEKLIGYEMMSSADIADQRQNPSTRFRSDDRWHDPYSACSEVSRRQNLCSTSPWWPTGNDLRYPQIDIAILYDLRLTSLIKSISRLRTPIDPPARKYE